MKYLKRVTLKNFQSHKNTVVDFDKGLNIIVGPSDTGKTAIIRGIKWVLYNEPAGDYFIREGETEASVTLEFSNNIKVKRFRSKSKNAYILYNLEGDEMIFEGFGNKVPQEIIDLISIKKVPLDSNESNSINIGEQLEGAFLLSEKGSTRASAIGRLIGVNLIDDALKDTLRDLRNFTSDKRHITKNVNNIETELKEYEYLDELQEDIAKLENIRNILIEKIQIKGKLKKITEEYKENIAERGRINNILSKLANIDKLDSNINSLEGKYIKLNYYKGINKKLQESQSEINNNENILKDLCNINYIEDELINISSIMSKLKKLKKLEIQNRNYKQENKTIMLINENLQELNTATEKTRLVEQKVAKLKSLNIMNKKIKSVYMSIGVGKDYIDKLKDLDTVDVIFKDLTISIRNINKVMNLSKTLNSCRSSIKQENQLLIKGNRSIDKNLKLYESLLRKNEICPFCLSDINESKIEHIIEHYT